MVEFTVMSGNNPYTRIEYENMSLVCPRNSCFTCRHCSDFIWDYSNGPYLIACNLNQRSTTAKMSIDPGVLGYCAKYENDLIDREVLIHDD